MKMLLLQAFPRTDGYTSYCTNLFLKGVAETDCDLTICDITRKDINPCLGCFHCWCATPGRCIQQDAMHTLLETFLASDLIVCASPLYAYAVSSYLKIFFERTLPLLTPGVTKTPQGTDRNRLRYPDRGPKHMAAIIVGGLGAQSHAEGAVTSLKLYAEGFNMNFAGTLVRNESYLLQFADTKPKTVKRIESAFEQAGRTFAQQQRIATELINRAATPLAIDTESFENYSNIYWEYAEAVYARGGTLNEIHMLTRSDIRILMQEMARSIDPVSTARLTATLLFVFPDKPTSYTVAIIKGKALLEERDTSAFNLCITCSSTVWAGIVHRTVDPLKALTSGSIKLVGEKELFRKLGRYFPPPNL